MPYIRYTLYVISCVIAVGCATVDGTTRAPRAMNSEYELSSEEKARLISAAERRDRDAAYRLYLYFEFVARDSRAAMKWLRTAAENGHIRGQYALGIYLRMSEEPSERRDGLVWLERSARAGNADAKERMEQIASGRFPSL